MTSDLSKPAHHDPPSRLPACAPRDGAARSIRRQPGTAHPQTEALQPSKEEFGRRQAPASASSSPCAQSPVAALPVPPSARLSTLMQRQAALPYRSTCRGMDGGQSCPLAHQRPPPGSLGCPRTPAWEGSPGNDQPGTQPGRSWTAKPQNCKK